MKKSITLILVFVICFTFAFGVNAGGSAVNVTGSFSAYAADEIGSAGVVSGKKTTCSFTIHSVGFNGLPPNVFPSNGLSMVAYDSTTRVYRTFTSCTTKSGNYTPSVSYVKIGMENNNSIGTTVCYTWTVN